MDYFIKIMSTCYAFIDLIDGISQSLDAKQMLLVSLLTHSTRLITNYYVKKNFLASVEWHVNG